MRILQAIAGAEHGGAETCFVDLMKALHEAGLELKVVIRQNAERAATLREAGIEPVELAFGGYFDFTTRGASIRDSALLTPDRAARSMCGACSQHRRGRTARDVMIVVATQCFPPRIGGMETLMCGLADALAASGRDVTVLADGHGDAAEAGFDRDRAYPVLRFPGLKPWRRWRKARVFAALARGERIDAIFADSWKSAERIAGAARDAGVPLVCLAHGDDVTATDDRRRRRVRRTLGQVTRIAANSAATAARVEALGIPRGRIAVVNPGVTPPAEPSAEARGRIARRLGAGRPLLITVARLEPRKGHDRAIAALPALLRDHPETVYAIAGAGPHRSALERLARETGVTDRVAFLGRVSDDDKAALLDAADLFVMPVREEVSARSVEGFGIAYIEAAFRSLPAVAGRSGGVADAVREGVTGLLCDGEDPDNVERVIREAIADPQRLARLGAAARETAEREFAWPVAVERYLACIG